MRGGGGQSWGEAGGRGVVVASHTDLGWYDEIVRVGGDEFVCALGDADPGEARRRFRAIGATLERSHPGASVSVGFAALRPDDTLAQLTQRGDFSLYEAKRLR
mgnify:CR=1 FL=1